MNFSRFFGKRRDLRRTNIPSNVTLKKIVIASKSMEQIIYTTESPDYKTGPNKFGICMATYQRKNGSSPSYLKRSLDALLAQTATNWHLYLVGDKYEDNAEFLECIARFPKDKITVVNLPVASERENIVDKMDLWKVAGSNAFNHAHELALADGCDYILHHDDDDPFHRKKIQILNYILSLYKQPTCLFHYSTYINIILPREHITAMGPNNLQPREGNVIHTALCIHKSVVSVFKYDGYRIGKMDYTCGDIQLIRYLNALILSDPNKYTVFIPLLLCKHDIEGEARL